MIDPLHDLSGLQHAMDFHLQRHGVLASNLANADTPNYEPRDLSFRAAMQSLPLAASDARHVGVAGGAEAAPQFAVETQAHEPHLDGNGVEIEGAMAQVTANRLRYETGAELARRRLALLRYAAGDGR